MKLSNPALFVTVEEVFSLSILEGTAGNDIDPNENHHSDNQYYVCFPPFLSKVPKQTSLTGVAIVAELAQIIVPSVAIRISHLIHRVCPHDGAHIVEPA